MKHTFTMIQSFCNTVVVKSSLKKLALVIFLLFSLTMVSNAQSRIIDNHHEDTVIYLERNAFSISVSTEPGGKLNFELINNQANDITPFFIEFYIKGHILDEGHLTQSLNNVVINENIERITGPQFVSLGINTLPAFGNYKNTLTTSDQTNEPSVILIRVSGSINGQDIFWTGSLNF